MMLLGYGAVFATSAVFTWLSIWPVRWLAGVVGAVALPGPRRSHGHATPTLGGSAMVVGFMAAVGVAATVPPFRAVFAAPQHLAAVVAGALFIFAVGVIDDLRELSAGRKLAGQVVGAAIVMLSGVRLGHGHLAVVPSPATVMLAVTFVWIVLVTNAINFMDGLDGLAAGIVAITAAALFVYSVHLIASGRLAHANAASLVAAAAAGACVGFLPHNRYPATIFMGDCGALFLGLLVATVSLLLADASSTGAAGFRLGPLAIPSFILGVPLADTGLAIVRRTRGRISPARADQDHLHHRLIRLGHRRPQATLLLCGWTAALSALALIPVFSGHGPLLLIAAAMGAALNRRRRRRHPLTPAPQASSDGGVSEAQGRTLVGLSR